MFKVYWVNHFYFADREFDTFTAAVTYGKSKCMDFSVVRNDQVVAGWSYFSGLTIY